MHLLRPRAAAALALIALAAPATAKDAPLVSRYVESIHQPVVQRTDYVFDVETNAAGGLGPVEQVRLIGWFDALNLGYGDHVAIAAQGAAAAPAARSAITDLVGAYGLLLADLAPVTAGDAAPGALRIVVSRSVASVPDCPNWRDKYEADLVAGAGSNYGCAVNSNLAAMVANPDDLVNGKGSRSDLRALVNSRAIGTWLQKAPTGAGDLKVESTGGK
jgi:pilus assembly protein CpaD